MTQKQYDAMYLAIQSLSSKVAELKNEVNKQSLLIDSLQKKTIVISDMDKQINTLSVEVASLKDEVRA